MRPVHRLAPLLLLSLLAFGCSEQTESFPCPGSPIAALNFTGTQAAVSCAAGSAPAAGINALYPASVTFSATITSTTSGTGAALCLSVERAEPMLGSGSGDVIDVSLDTQGALLTPCNTRCAVTVHQQVTGTVLRGPGGAPTGFSGTLTDTATMDATVTGADCTPCVTPCRSSYALTGVIR